MCVQTVMILVEDQMTTTQPKGMWASTQMNTFHMGNVWTGDKCVHVYTYMCNMLSMYEWLCMRIYTCS